MATNDITSPKPLKRACVIPLHYSCKHWEYSVSLVSNNWESLSHILEAPAEHLRALQNEWKPYADDMPTWHLARPVTALLQYGYGSYHAIRQTANQIALDSQSIASRANADTAGLDLSLVPLLLRPFIVEILMIKDAFREGGYYLEFARDTRTLSIFYFPPQKFMAATWAETYPDLLPAGASIPSRTLRHPPSSLTDATLSLQDGPYKGGTFHFDIGKTEMERASFVWDFIGNPSCCIQRWNDTYDPTKSISGQEKKRFIPFQTPMVPAGCTLVNAQAGDPICLWKDLSLKVDKNQPVCFLSFEALENSPMLSSLVADMYPTLTVEGLSSDSPSDVCTQTPVTEVDNTYVLGTMTVKSYLDLSPNPPSRPLNLPVEGTVNEEQHHKPPC